MSKLPCASIDDTQQLIRASLTGNQRPKSWPNTSKILVDARRSSSRQTRPPRARNAADKAEHQAQHQKDHDETACILASPSHPRPRRNGAPPQDLGRMRSRPSTRARTRAAANLSSILFGRTARRRSTTLRSSTRSAHRRYARVRWNWSVGVLT